MVHYYIIEDYPFGSKHVIIFTGLSIIPAINDQSDDFFNPLLWNRPICFFRSIGNRRGIHSSTKYSTDYCTVSPRRRKLSPVNSNFICVRVGISFERCTTRGKHDTLRESHDATMPRVTSLIIHRCRSFHSSLNQSVLFIACPIHEVQRLYIILGCRWLISWVVPLHNQNTQLYTVFQNYTGICTTASSSLWTSGSSRYLLQGYHQPYLIVQSLLQNQKGQHIKCSKKR